MNIEPIKLLSGHHEDTATTGSGCFMNVIAYLNGEAQITDYSPCVCASVRRLAIELNDRSTDGQRQRLLPFVLRAMGSATEDEKVMYSRIARLKQYGAECEELVGVWSASIRRMNCPANQYSRVNGYTYHYESAHACAYESAHAYANAYAWTCINADDFYGFGTRKQRDCFKSSLFDASLRYLDDVLPKLDAVAPEVVERSACLVELFKKHNPEFASI